MDVKFDITIETGELDCDERNEIRETVAKLIMLDSQDDISRAEVGRNQEKEFEIIFRRPIVSNAYTFDTKEELLGWCRGIRFILGRRL